MEYYDHPLSFLFRESHNWTFLPFSSFHFLNKSSVDGWNQTPSLMHLFPLFIMSLDGTQLRDPHKQYAEMAVNSLLVEPFLKIKWTALSAITGLDEYGFKPMICSPPMVFFNRKELQFSLVLPNLEIFILTTRMNIGLKFKLMICSWFHSQLKFFCFTSATYAVFLRNEVSRLEVCYKFQVKSLHILVMEYVNFMYLPVFFLNRHQSYVPWSSY